VGRLAKKGEGGSHGAPVDSNYLEGIGAGAGWKGEEKTLLGGGNGGGGKTKMGGEGSLIFSCV